MTWKFFLVYMDQFSDSDKESILNVVNRFTQLIDSVHTFKIVGSGFPNQVDFLFFLGGSKLKNTRMKFLDLDFDSLFWKKEYSGSLWSEWIDSYNIWFGSHVENIFLMSWVTLFQTSIMQHFIWVFKRALIMYVKHPIFQPNISKEFIVWVPIIILYH